MESDLYSSGVFASELEEEFSGTEKELDPDTFLPEEDEPLEEEEDEDLDDEDDESSYNPLEDYKSEDWS